MAKHVTSAFGSVIGSCEFKLFLLNYSNLFNRIENLRMSEEVNRESLLEIAAEFYQGDLLGYVRKNLTPKRQLVAQVLNKLIENLRVRHPERNFAVDSLEQANLKQSVCRVMKGLS